jgi:hypothetical protein
VQDGFLGASQLNIKPREEIFFQSWWYDFELRERPSHPRLLQQMKSGSIIVNKRLKGNPWNGTILNLPRRKNSPSVDRVMIIVFWDCEGVILVDVMLRGETVKFITYVRTLSELRKHFKRVWPHNSPTGILLQHDSAELHTSLKTWEAITKFGWAISLHPLYSPV